MGNKTSLLYCVQIKGAWSHQWCMAQDTLVKIVYPQTLWSQLPSAAQSASVGEPASSSAAPASSWPPLGWPGPGAERGEQTVFKPKKYIKH